MPRNDMNRMPEIVRELGPAVDAAIRSELESLVASAREILAGSGWDTQALEAAIHVEAAPEGYYVIAGNSKVWYGHIVEHGSAERRTHDRPDRAGHPAGRMPARPFLVPALEMHRDAIVGAVETAVRRVAG